MSLSVDDMLRLTEGMRSRGVLAFEAGDFKVSFALEAPALPVSEPLQELGDEEEDLFFSSPIRRKDA